MSTDRAWSDVRNEVVSFMRERQYDIETEGKEIITFRRRGTVNRLTRMFEDRITLSLMEDGFEMEGLRKDVFRLSVNLEYRLNPQQ